MFELIRRRRLVIVSVLTIALIPAMVVPFLLPARFVATAKISILGTPEVMDIGADVLPDAPRLRRNPLSPKIAIAESDRVLGRVVDKMPDPRPRRPGLKRKLLSALGIETRKPALSPELSREARINGLRSSVQFSGIGGGSILRIDLVSGTPSTTAFLVNAVADAFVQDEADQRQKAARRAVTWLNQKASELRDQIDRREQAMNGRTADSDQLSAIPMHGAEGARGQLASQLRAARVELLAVQERKAQIEPLIRSVPQVQPDESLMALRGRYAQIQQELETARLRFTATHPEVRRLESVLEGLQRKLGVAQARAPAVADDPVGPDLRREYQGIRLEEARLTARVRVVSRALRDMVRSSVENAGAIAEYERLEREASVDRNMLQVVLQRLNQAVLTSVNPTESSRVLDYAVMPTSPISPNRPLLVGVGLILALGLAFGSGLLAELRDPALYNAEDVARELDIPLIGMIPVVPANVAAERQTTLDYATPAGESFRNLRTSVLFSGGNIGLRSLLIASAVAGEGKTTVAINLAASIAQTDRRVLLIDADMRRPRIDSVLALLRGPGLAELVRGDAKLEEVIRRPIGFEVDVITSGEIPENPTELLESARFERILARLVDDYDMVVIDGPVLLSVSDALLLSARADRVLLVNKLGSVDKRAFARMREDLDRMKARVMGLVANQVKMSDPYQYPSYFQSPYVSRQHGRERKSKRPTRAVRS